MSALLDASAVLALLQNEPGADRVAARLRDASISAVNVAEVIGKMIERGFSVEAATDTFLALRLPMVSFTPTVAIDAGMMRGPTRRLGLSLADRACLAEAKAGGHAVLTADRAWAKLDLGVEVEVIR